MDLNHSYMSSLSCYVTLSQLSRLLSLEALPMELNAIYSLSRGTVCSVLSQYAWFYSVLTKRMCEIFCRTREAWGKSCNYKNC
jgi:hypothetical protein